MGDGSGFGVWCDFDGPEHDSDTPGIGVHVHVLQPGEAPGYYHAEEAQEGFIVLSGECIAIVEGQELRMRQWDYLQACRLRDACPVFRRGFVGDPFERTSWSPSALASRRHSLEVDRNDVRSPLEVQPGDVAAGRTWPRRSRVRDPDYKVKTTPHSQAKADHDPQAVLYLAGRWLAGEPAHVFCFAQIAKPGPQRKVERQPRQHTRSAGQLRTMLVRIDGNVLLLHRRYR